MSKYAQLVRDYFTRTLPLIKRVLYAIYLLIMAVWLTAIYVFEYAGHYRIYLCGEQATWLTPFTLSSRLCVMAGLVFLLILLAALITKEFVTKVSDVIKAIVIAMWHALKETRSHLVFLVVGSLAVCGPYLLHDRCPAAMVYEIKTAVVSSVELIAWIVMMLLAVLAIWAFFVHLGRNISKIGFRGLYEQWISGSVVVLPVYVFGMIAAIHMLHGAQPAEVSETAWRGVAKDFPILFIVTSFYAIGLLKFCDSAGKMAQRARWTFLGIALGLVAFCAAATLALDHQCCFGIETGSFAKELYPWQRRAVIDFIHIRDWGLLVPLVIIHGCFVLGNVATSVPQPEEDQK